MKQSLIPLSAIISVLVAGCTLETFQPVESQGRLVTISASIDAEGTKATVTDGGLFTWASGDRIGVWTSLDRFVSFSLKSGESGKSSAAFEGTLSDGETIIGPAVYPYRAGHSYDPSANTLTYNQGSADDWTANTTKSHMAAKYDGGDNFSFRHLDGLLRITVYNLPPEAARIRIIAPDKAINGDFAVDMNAESPVISAPSGSNSRIDMKLNDKNTGEVGLGFVVNYPLPVGDYTNMTFAILDSEQNVIAGYSKTISSLSITRKKMVNMPEVTFGGVLLANNEAGSVAANFMKNDTGSPYPNTEGTSLTVESNTVVSAANASSKVLMLDASGQTSPLYKGGYFPFTTKEADYSSGFRSSTKAFTVKIRYNDADDASRYYPRAWCKGGKLNKIATTEATLPDRINGQAFDGTSAKWAQFIKTDDWNILQWTIDTRATWRIDFTPFLTLDGALATDGSKVMYLDDFRFLTQAYPAAQAASSPISVNTKEKASDVSWTPYLAYTVDCVEGLVPEPDPATNKYGGWTARDLGNADGYFRVRKIGNRWWMIDPLGNPYLSKGTAVFSPGNSDRQKANITSNYGGKNSNWAKAEIPFLFSNGFNSVGAWSEHSLIKTWLTDSERIPYTIILSPMGSYIGELRNSSDPVLTAAFADSGWENYPYDFAMVFDDRFDTHIATEVAKATEYASEKHLIGYFLDNEVPWKNYALEWCLTKWPEGHINRTTAQNWLDTRKGKSGATISEATAEDKQAFIAFCYETYLQKVTTALRAQDPNHLVFGPRLNQWDHELSNPALLEVAGRYLDAVPVNFYQRWQPETETLRNWESWSGKPVLISEFYVKGSTGIADPLLTNESGAGWIVETQEDRGLFYQNFVIQLLKSKVCVGWHWFSYMDNDPTGPSSGNANKGIVQWDCTRYDDCVSQMEAINSHTFNLATFYD